MLTHENLYHYLMVFAGSMKECQLKIIMRESYTRVIKQSLWLSSILWRGD